MTPTIPTTLTYPAMVYQKTDAPPGYKAAEVQSADDIKTLAQAGPVFLTAQGALAFAAPPEQPIPHIQRTQNEEQFVIGKSETGRFIETPLMVPPQVNTYARQGVVELGEQKAADAAKAAEAAGAPPAAPDPFTPIAVPDPAPPAAPPAQTGSATDTGTQQPAQTDPNQPAS